MTQQPRITIVVAMDRAGLIGRGNRLPWNIREERRVFRALTMGRPVIMGRRTWQSLPKPPLSGRTNIVLTSDRRLASYLDARYANLVDGAVHAARSFAEALALAAAVHEDVMVIGGASVYASALPRADRIAMSLVAGDHEGDVYFPGGVPGPPGWREDDEPIQHRGFSSHILMPVR
jgi:dihydrofolate reductase